MFSMFLNSPPASTPVSRVYSEERPFGPYGRAAGEQSAESGFAEALWLRVARSAPETFRILRVICDGTLRALGPQQGFPADDSTAPYDVELVPAPNVMRELERLCTAQKAETPRRIIYHGVDIASLTSLLNGYFTGQVALRLLDPVTNRFVQRDPAELSARFVAGELTVPVIQSGLGPGRALGLVSARNLQNGSYRFGIEIQTGPLLQPQNRLDPVTLFGILATGKLGNGSGGDAIDAAEKQNSWIDVVTRSRILITFRDEWNAPLLNPVDDAIVAGPAGGPGAGQVIRARLDADHQGTVVAPSGWILYTCSFGEPSLRKVTQVPSADAAADRATVDAAGPAHRIVSTVRPEDWFLPADPPYTGTPGHELSRYTQGNIVEPLIDGLAAFRQLTADLRELDDSTPPQGQFPDNFVLIAGWYLDIRFDLIPGDRTTRTSLLLANGVRSRHKLIVRALVWAENAAMSTDTSPILMIRELDTRNPAYTRAGVSGTLITAFHWKCTVVRNRFGTFASLGGIDINPNRLDDAEHKPGGARYHDVHCRIQGPAVADVTKAFLSRWTMDRVQTDADIAVNNSIRPTVETPPEVPATQMVQIARTYRRHTGTDDQPWSPAGDRTIWANLRNAIARARNYIYIEEQYLVSADLRDALLAALARPDRNVRVVIVISEICTDSGDGTQQDAFDRGRYIFLKDLINHPRVQVYTLGSIYVHTKVTIVDDVFATIGSANLNRRGLTHDAEINAFVLDGRVENGVRKFARDLRTRLWAEHLGMALSKENFTKLNDVEYALDLIKNHRPPSSRLIPYTTRNPGSEYATGWDTFYDPDGR